MEPRPSSVFLNAPIPGMSLTTEPGNRPWENPPSMSTVEEALEYYANRIFKADKFAMDDLIDVIESGFPIRNFANVLQTTSVMQGRHTLDVGFLVLPAIEEMLMAVADLHGVKYNTSVEEIINSQRVSRRQARLAAMEALKTVEELEPEMPEMPAMPSSKGLMARPSEQPPMEENNYGI
jgi:hypothetical protein